MTLTDVPRSASRDVPRRAPELEFLGPYKDSGFQDPPYLVRRNDGNVVQLSRLLYLVALHADGTRDLASVAHRVSGEFGRAVSSDNVAYLIDNKLRPLGLCDDGASGASAPAGAAPPSPLQLAFKRAVVPRSLVGFFARALRPLFFAPLALATTIAFVALDAWILFRHGIAQALDIVLHHPVIGLALFGLTLASAMFHEVGHATACRKGGASPGPIGVGVYLIWPACYADVTDAYRLDRRGRLRTDFGGWYFSSLFVLLLGAVYWRTRWEPLLLAILIQNAQMAAQLLPFVRTDGYFVLADLIGVPDPFVRFGRIVRRVLPGGRKRIGKSDLKLGARITIAVWVCVTAPLLALVATALLLHVPAVGHSLWSAARLQWDALVAAERARDLGSFTLALVQLLVLSAPVLGAIAFASRVVRLIARRLSRPRPAQPERAGRQVQPPTPEHGGSRPMRKDPAPRPATTFTVKRHGFDETEVTAHLEAMARQRQELDAEVAQRTAELAQARADLDQVRAELAETRAELNRLHDHPEEAMSADLVDLLATIRAEAYKINDRATSSAEALRQTARKEVRLLMREITTMHRLVYEEETALLAAAADRVETMRASLKEEQRSFAAARRRLKAAMEALDSDDELAGEPSGTPSPASSNGHADAVANGHAPASSNGHQPDVSVAG